MPLSRQCVFSLVAEDVGSDWLVVAFERTRAHRGRAEDRETFRRAGKLILLVVGRDSKKDSGQHKVKVGKGRRASCLSVLWHGCATYNAKSIKIKLEV